MGTIVFLGRTLHVAGAERQLTALSIGLHERGHRVVVVTFYAGGVLEQELRQGGVEVWSLRKAGRWDMVGPFLRLLVLLKRERPDVLHGYLKGPNLLASFASLLFPAIRVVWSVRGSMEKADDYLGEIIHLVEGGLSRTADIVVANSYAGREEMLAKGVPPAKVVVIPNGIDTRRFAPDRATGQHVRAAWGVQATERVIGIVGRLHPSKGYTIFLQAAEQVARLHTDVRFVCVGKTVDKAYLEQLYTLGAPLQRSGNLIWAHERSDMPAVYNACDIVVMPSLAGEGFPNAIGEAMACGVPCIVTDVGDMAWIVGDMGLVIPAGSVEHLTEAMITMLAHLSDYRSDRIRARIMHNFGLETLITTTEHVLFARGSGTPGV